MSNMIQLKIIETFSKINDYRKHIKFIYSELNKVLKTENSQHKREKGDELRSEASNIKKDTVKYFDCLDGLREKLEYDMEMITTQMKRMNRAEQSIKRVRKITERVSGCKSTTSKKEIEDIAKELDNLETYMEKYLTHAEVD